MNQIVNALYRVLFVLIGMLGLYILINGFFVNHVIVKEIYQVTREHIDALVWTTVLVLLVIASRIRLNRKHGLTILLHGSLF